MKNNIIKFINSKMQNLNLIAILEKKFPDKSGYIFIILGSIQLSVLSLLFKLIKNINSYQILYLRSVIAMIFNYYIIK